MNIGVIVSSRIVAFWRANQPRLSRLSGYVFWTLFDQFCVIGLPQMALFPLLAYQMGNEEFGVFVLAIGFITMIGGSPSLGLQSYILRDAVNYPEHERFFMVRTMMVMSLIITVPIGLVFILGNSWIAETYRTPLLARLFPPLGCYLIFFNVVETGLAIFRMLRQFHRMAIVHLCHNLLLFSAIPLYRIGGFDLLSYAWIISTFLTIILFVVMQSREIFRTPVFHWGFARAALQCWWPFSLSSFLTLSAGKLDRLFLGYWWPPEVVAGFYVAISIASVFILPLSLISGLILSLLSSKKDQYFWKKQQYLLYGLGSTLCCVALCLLGMAIGTPVLQTFYPTLAQDALPLWTPVIIGIVIGALPVMLRPFITKFLPPVVMLRLITVSMMIKVGLVLALVPRYGASGAAFGVLLASLATSGLWLLTYAWHLILKPVREDSIHLFGGNDV